MAKAKIVWRERALEDIDRLYDFLFKKNEEVAAKAAQVIIRGSSLLEESPRLGRPMADATGRRELFIPFGSGFYVLRYFLTSDTVLLFAFGMDVRTERKTRSTRLTLKI